MTTEFNLHNMNSAIIIMERAKIHNSLDMRHFQGANDFGLSCTTDGLHACMKFVIKNSWIRSRY